MGVQTKPRAEKKRRRAEDEEEEVGPERVRAGGGSRRSTIVQQPTSGHSLIRMLANTILTPSRCQIADCTPPPHTDTRRPRLLPSQEPIAHTSQSPIVPPLQQPCQPPCYASPCVRLALQTAAVPVTRHTSCFSFRMPRSPPSRPTLSSHPRSSLNLTSTNPSATFPSAIRPPPVHLPAAAGREAVGAHSESSARAAAGAG